MKTDDLVDLLSNDIFPTRSGVPARRFGVALTVAVIGGTLLLIAAIGIRADLVVVLGFPIFWERLAFPFCVGMGALITTSRLARPGAKARIGWVVMTTPVVIVWVAGVLFVATTAPQERLLTILGHSWRQCAFRILLLSVPGFIAIFWAVKGLAPTRLRSTGAACGLLASSIGSVIYCFHCREMSPAFWSTWYLLGMLLPGAFGAMLGPKVLRW